MSLYQGFGSINNVWQSLELTTIGLTQLNPILFATNIDVYSQFNVANGIFTAIVAGYYFCQVNSQIGTTNGSITLFINKNGAPIYSFIENSSATVTVSDNLIVNGILFLNGTSDTVSFGKSGVGAATSAFASIFKIT